MTYCLALMLLAGCAPEKSPETPPLVGADTDAHGCKASAGYAWCARESSCVRAWELAKDKGFDASESGFAQYCEASKE